MSRRELVTKPTLEQVDSFFSVTKTVTNVDTIHVSPENITTPNLIHADGVTYNKPDDRKAYIPPYNRQSRSNVSHQTNYARHCKEADIQSLLQATQRMSDDPTNSTLGGSTRLTFDVDSTTATPNQPHVGCDNEMSREQACNVYTNYNFKHKYDDRLPIVRHRDEIVDTVNCNQVTIIQGETGCGKTTQVPQFILDYHVKENKYCNIIVTQPRRIAAITISNRVSKERRWGPEKICGYQIGLDDPHYCEDTRILYCTTGILLRKLIKSKSMNQYTHVILDEVHERDSLSDFALLIVRKLLHTVSRYVKVILMSATMDARVFAEYFPVPIGTDLVPSQILHIDGRVFTVKEYFTDDLKELGEIPDSDLYSPTITSDAYSLAVRLIEKFDELEASSNFEEESTGNTQKRGAVLVFLPGIHEIAAMKSLLASQGKESQYVVLPLHSSITAIEQDRIFEPVKVQQRKIILSTNIAESSITIRDIRYVIDFCLTKELVCDPVTSYSSLQCVWASKRNCLQRKGRAGRVFDGRVYFMVSKRFFKRLPEYGIPEMQRCPLEQLVLKVKVFDLGEPKHILGLALSPPNLDDIEKHIVLLFEIGALLPMREEINPHDGKLTLVGRIMEDLPIDIRFTKLVLLGNVFNALEECIIIAAGLSLKSCFIQKFDYKLVSFWCKYDWSEGSNSDCFAILNAYQTWQKNIDDKQFKDTEAEFRWCQDRFLDMNQMRNMKRLVDEIKLRLRNYNILPPDPRRQQSSRHHSEPKLSQSQKNFMLKMVICGAFYPNFFVSEKRDEEDAIRAMSGYDPHTTVMVRNIPRDQGSLYSNAIEKKFRECQKKMIIHYEDTRAYIEFPRQMSDYKFKVSPAVLKALKMRQLRINLDLVGLDSDVIQEHLKKQDLQRLEWSRDSKVLATNRLTSASEFDDSLIDFPPPMSKTIYIKVMEVTDCGLLWAQYKHSDMTLGRIHQRINSTRPPRLNPCDLKEGAYCLAFFKDEGDLVPALYRAKIEKLHSKDRKNAQLQTVADILFVDYGNYSYNVSTKELFQLSSEDLHNYKLQAFQMEIAGIRPSPLTCENGRWTPEAKFRFRDILLASWNELIAEVYSVLRGVVRVHLYGTNSDGQYSIGDKLIAEGFAEKCEETLQSKRSHDERTQLALLVTQGRISADTTVVPRNAVRLNSEAARSEKQLASQSANFQTYKNSAPKVLGADRSASNRRIHLIGPENPLEVHFYSLGNNGNTKVIRVEADSVNSVVVDDEPSERYSRMLVAGTIRLSGSNSDAMLLGNTTLMPGIRALPAIATMLFTPYMELRTDRRKLRLTGALCGLGWDSYSDGSYLPEHDIELVFDAEITNHDIRQINAVRKAMNMALGGTFERLNFNDDGMSQLQKLACKNLLELFEKTREAIQVVTFFNQYEFHQLDAADIIAPKESSQNKHPSESWPLYQLHNQIALRKTQDDEDTLSCHTLEIHDSDASCDEQNREKYARLKRMQEELDMLRSTAVKGDHNPLNMWCEICQTQCSSRHELHYHLLTNKHRDSELKIQMNIRKMENPDR